MATDPGTADLRRLLDREAIRDLLAHYCFCLDAGQPARLADEVFTEDGVDDHGLGEWRGRNSIRTGFVEVMSRFEGTAHVLGNVRIDIDGDQARSSAYVSAWHWLAGGSRDRPADFLVVGVYLDRLRHERRAGGSPTGGSVRSGRPSSPPGGCPRSSSPVPRTLRASAGPSKTFPIDVQRYTLPSSEGPRAEAGAACGGTRWEA